VKRAAKDSLEIMFHEEAQIVSTPRNQVEGFEDLFLVRRCG
jgi:hypothetical protein